MKDNIRLKYFLLIIFISFKLFSKEKDTIVQILNHKEYGLRFGVDLLKPFGLVEGKYYTGYEFSIDGRIYKNFFIPIEFGYEKDKLDFFVYNIKIDGFFLKTGFDYSFNKALYETNSAMSIGARIAYSKYNVVVPNYYIDNDYWNIDKIEGNIEKENISSYWAEVVLGLKVELFYGIFLGGGVRYCIYLGGDKYNTKVDATYIPGFGEVFTGRNFRINYGIYYMIPLGKEK